MSGGPVVVAVLAHRDAPLLRRLVARVLEGDRTVVLVHHDPRGPDPGLVPGDRVHLVPDPQPCDWGRVNLADAMLRCLDEAHRVFPDLDWLLLTSGQDYPAQHLRRTEHDLDATDLDAQLRWFRVDPRPQPGEIPWQARCRRRYLQSRRLPGSHRSAPWARRHPFGGGTDLFIGDMWANLGAAAVAHVLEQRERRPDLRSYLATCSVPDEALLPTLLLNDADHLRVGADRKRWIRWVEGRPNPELVRPEDVESIAASGDWFARKVDSEQTPEVLDLLDAAARCDVRG